ncbi:MAG: transposase [Candidatus Dormibacteria bacterium]
MLIDVPLEPRGCQEPPQCAAPTPDSYAAALRVGRHHAKVAHLRRDHLHKLPTTLAKAHHRVVVEDLDVEGMLGNGLGGSPGIRAGA